MPLSLLSIPAWPRPLRRSGPSCRGGASSLLRLASPAARRLPSRLELAQWAQRAAAGLEADLPEGPWRSLARADERRCA